MFDSKEEEYFFWWLEEAKNHGLLTEFIFQPKPFNLFDKVKVEYFEQLKTKVKVKDSTLLREHKYQADFLIRWDSKWIFKLFLPWDQVGNHFPNKVPFVANRSRKSDEFFSVVDVKGTFNQNDAWRRFAINQKWVFQNFNIYVQKLITHPSVKKDGRIIPASALFYKTFVPERFLYTNKSNKPRKIKYPIKSIKEYIASFE